MIIWNDMTGVMGRAPAMSCMCSVGRRLCQLARFNPRGPSMRRLTLNGTACQLPEDYRLFQYFTGAAKISCSNVSGNVQVAFREHSGDIQGTFREHSGNIQGTNIQGTNNQGTNIQGTNIRREHTFRRQPFREQTFREHSGSIKRTSIQGAFREHRGNKHSGNIQGAFGEHNTNARNIQGASREHKTSQGQQRSTFPILHRGNNSLL